MYECSISVIATLSFTTTTAPRYTCGCGPPVLGRSLTQRELIIVNSDSWVSPTFQPTHFNPHMYIQKVVSFGSKARDLKLFNILFDMYIVAVQEFIFLCYLVDLQMTFG